MNTLRLNITIPYDLGRELKKVKNMSGFIAAAVREKMSRQRKISRRKMLVDAYKQSAVQEARLSKDWDATTREGL
jgi:hypothetical protein